MSEEKTMIELFVEIAQAVAAYRAELERCSVVPEEAIELTLDFQRTLVSNQKGRPDIY